MLSNKQRLSILENLKQVNLESMSGVVNNSNYFVQLHETFRDMTAKSLITWFLI